MAHHYVVTAHKPTAVNACVTGKKLTNYNLQFIIHIYNSPPAIYDDNELLEYKK